MKTFIHAIRFLSRSKTYTLINLLGLAFSLACCIVLMRYIHREMTVDTHCIDREKVFAIKLNQDGTEFLGNLGMFIYDSVKIDRRHIETRTQYIPLPMDYLTVNGHRFEAAAIATDSAYFKLFHYPLLQGQMALDKPESILLKKDFAQRLFGKENPVGKTVRYSNGKELTVVGILDEPDCKTSIHFDMVVPSHLSDFWASREIELFRFLPGTDMDVMNRIAATPRHLNNPQWDKRLTTFRFSPVEEIYWNSGMGIDSKVFTMFRKGEKPYIYILSGACLLLFITGVLNFINLYLVTMIRRGREYGLKKIYGAGQSTLFLQIWLENALLILSALITAWFFIEVTQIPINRLLETDFVYTPFDGWLSLGIMVFLPLMASAYPFVKYYYGTSVRTIQSIGWSSHSVRSRMVFLGVQYALTFLTTICALYFNKQLNLMLDTEPGFRTKNLLYAQVVYRSLDGDILLGNNEEQFKRMQAQQEEIMEKIKACPYIESLEPSATKFTIPLGISNTFITPEGNKATLNSRWATRTFFQTFGIELKEGDLPKPHERGYVVNEAAMKALGLTSLEGTSVKEEKTGNRFIPLCAVVKDFYDGHLTMGVQPVIYVIVDGMGSHAYYMSFQDGKKEELIAYLRNAIKEVYGLDDFEYSLLEDDVKALYKEDRKIAGIYNIFALIGIVVSCLGLFGISLFDIRQRYREIAIRKVNGAGIKDLYRLLFRKYLITLGVSFVIATPLAYYLLHQYTADFVVKASIGIGIFALALLLVAIISCGTLSWQIRKAANINPGIIMKRE